jgi:hypothetical protein
MNADKGTRIAADDFMKISMTCLSSAGIGAGSAFIGAFKASRSHHFQA